MRSQLLAPIHRGIEGESFCRCRPDHAVDLSIFPPFGSVQAAHKVPTQGILQCQCYSRPAGHQCKTSRYCGRRRLRPLPYRRCYRGADLKASNLIGRVISDDKRSRCSVHGAHQDHNVCQHGMACHSAFRARVPTGLMGNCAKTLLERIIKDSPPLLTWFKGELDTLGSKENAPHLLARSEGRMRLHYPQSLLH